MTRYVPLPPETPPRDNGMLYETRCIDSSELEDSMARVQGIKDKLHWPLYDAFVVAAKNGSKAPALVSEIKKRAAHILRFFVDVQNRTRLFHTGALRCCKGSL